MSWEFDIMNSYTDMRISLGGVVVGSSIDLEEHFTGTMNHVVMVFDTPMERWRLYINESMIFDDERPPAGYDIETTNPIRIGYNGALNGIVGQFDDLTIYGRALAEDDVHALFHHRN